MQSLFPGKISGHHTEEKDPKRPDINAVLHHKPTVLGGLTKFWCCVRDGATHSLFSRPGDPGHTEIRELHFSALFVKDKNVFGFDVTMDKLAVVQVVQGQRYLVDTAFCGVFRKSNLKPQNKYSA